MRGGIVDGLSNARSRNGNKADLPGEDGPKGRKASRRRTVFRRYDARVTGWDLRPRTVGELLDAAFFVYRRQFARLVLVAFVVSVPALVLATLYAGEAAVATRELWHRITETASRPDGMFGDERLMRAMDSFQPFALLSGVLQSGSRAAGVATIALAGAAALRRSAPPSALELFREALPRLPAAVLAQIVLDQLFGCLVLCPPIGIVFATLLCTTPVVIVLERGPLERAVRAGVPAAARWALLPFVTAMDGAVRSAQLAANGRTIARGTIFVFFLFTFVGVGDLAAAAAGMLLGRTEGAWFWANHYAETLLLPVIGLGLSFWYADLRVRREGLDFAVAS
jgi:hypothetical protein